MEGGGGKRRKEEVEQPGEDAKHLIGVLCGAELLPEPHCNPGFLTVDALVIPGGEEGEDEDDEGIRGRKGGGEAPLHGKLPPLDTLLADALVVPGGEEGEDEDDEGIKGRKGGGGAPLHGKLPALDALLADFKPVHLLQLLIGQFHQA